MSISETIDTVAKALSNGAAPSIIKLALMSDGFPANKAETIIGWANQHNAPKEPSMKSIEEMKQQYPWEEGMGEISGFGGGYEQACRDMVYSGLAWLETKSELDLKATTYPGITGIFDAESSDAKALEEAVMSACEDCSGAMHHATMNACFFIAKNGWSRYVEEMKKRG